MSPESHDPELAALAKVLAGLAPAAGRLDRDELLFRAGQASLRRRAWLWPSVAAVLALVAGGVGLTEVLHPAPQGVQCIVYQRVEPAASPAELLAVEQPVPRDVAPFESEERERQAAPLSYLRLQRLVLAWGVDALPNPPAAPSSGGALVNALPNILSRNDWLEMQRH